MDFHAAKAECLALPLEQKRKLYKCKANYTPLDKVPTWNEYYTINKLKAADKSTAGDVLHGQTISVDKVFNDKISVWQGDISTLEVDAIVNAANDSLISGGGVDAAIHEAAGTKYLTRECAYLGGCKAGNAKITGGYHLPAKYIIHAVGPRDCIPDALQSCYERSLSIVVKNGLRSVAFPCIATGIYGFPREHAALVALHTVRSFLSDYYDVIDRIIFCTFLGKDKVCYEKLLPIFFPVE